MKLEQLKIWNVYLDDKRDIYYIFLRKQDNDMYEFIDSKNADYVYMPPQRIEEDLTVTKKSLKVRNLFFSAIDEYRKDWQNRRAIYNNTFLD